MGSVLEEFEQELDRVRQKFRGKPRREMVHLLLVALEREELAATGYRESPLAERLRAMPLDADTREIIRHALVWIWKDEEMHALYVRGAIFRLGSLRLRGIALGRQSSGWLGGWAASALIHTRWTTAPLSRIVARLAAAAGSLAGKVPAEVKRHLEYGPLRNFCRFNIEAERTAWLCWKRLAELAGDDDDADPHLADDFRRIMDDEDRHGRVFEILLDVLDDEDKLVEGQTSHTLAERVREVGESFLPRALRDRVETENSLGSGGRVWSFCGQTGGEKVPLFRRLLDESDLRERLDQRAEALGKTAGQMHVAVKPSFMLGYHRKDPSPLTDPVLVEELARWLDDHGYTEVAVVEGRNVYDRYFGGRTVCEVADYFGFRSPWYGVIDASDEQVPHQYARGMGQYTVGRTWKEADFRISFGKMRSHPVELALLTVGNVEWIGARCEQYLFTERQARRETAVMMLLDEFPPHFALLDGYEHVPDGLVGIMGSTRPKSPGRLYAGADALAVDIVAARHLGIRRPQQSSILRAACHWFGGWSQDVEVVGTDEPVRGWRGPYHSELSTLLSILAMPVYVHASARGALFVPEMDEDAFPPLEREGVLLRLGRLGVRSLLGLRHPRSGRRRE